MFRKVVFSFSIVLFTLIGGSMAAQDEEGGSGLVLWNQLGSDDEVLNSAHGPNLTFYTGGSGIHVEGDRKYVAGVEGKGVTLKGRYGTCDRVHNIVMSDLNTHLDSEKGSIEMWYYQVEVPVGYSHGEYRLFDGGYGLGAGIQFSVGDPWMGFGITCEEPWTQQVRHDVYSIPLGEWIHVAASWDRAGIMETDETVQLYINNTKVDSSTATNWGTIFGDEADICGGQDANIAGKFAIDELKIWDHAKTSFFEPDTLTLAMKPDPLVAGRYGLFEVTDGTPLDMTYLLLSFNGTGNTYLEPLGVTVELNRPELATRPVRSDTTGYAAWYLLIPPGAAGWNIWFQACQVGAVSNVVATQVQ